MSFNSIPPEILEQIVIYSPYIWLYVNKLCYILSDDKLLDNKNFVAKHIGTKLYVYLLRNQKLYELEVYANYWTNQKIRYSKQLVVAISKHGNLHIIKNIFDPDRYYWQYQTRLFNEFCRRGEISLVANLLDYLNSYHDGFLYETWKRAALSYSNLIMISLPLGIFEGIEHYELVVYLAEYMNKLQGVNSESIFSLLCNIIHKRPSYIVIYTYLWNTFSSLISRRGVIELLYTCIRSNNKDIFQLMISDPNIRVFNSEPLGSYNEVFENRVSKWKNW